VALLVGFVGCLLTQRGVVRRQEAEPRLTASSAR
jgi:hypothetical protein